MHEHTAGYAEGYYGRWPTWDERYQILDTLQALSLNTYLYAPKDDPQHRLYWREPYSAHWRDGFRAFCSRAQTGRIQIVAGVAPGLDFDFSHLPAGPDFLALLNKCQQLLSDGADCIALLLDDIDADFAQRAGDFSAEGEAHASLTNALSEALCAGGDDVSLWVTPRIYADEMIAETPAYLPDFLNTLDTRHTVLYCGSDIVAEHVDFQTSAIDGQNSDTLWQRHRRIVWDNLYANDYCPRRLFTGPWQGREAVSDVLLNATGMVHTDCLLLALMAERLHANDRHAEITDQRWFDILQQHGVPSSFQALAPWFWHPVFNTNHRPINLTDAQSLNEDDEVFQAIEHCLWRWKHPLGREWYAFLFGLRQDLHIAQSVLTPLRIRKTQTEALSGVLLQLY